MMNPLIKLALFLLIAITIVSVLYAYWGFKEKIT